MAKNAGSKPPSRPLTRPSTPRDDQQLIDPLVELSESENAKQVEDILRTNIEGFERDIDKAKQQAIATPGKETKIQALASKVKSYLTARPKHPKTERINIQGIHKNKFMRPSRMRTKTVWKK